MTGINIDSKVVVRDVLKTILTEEFNNWLRRVDEYAEKQDAEGKPFDEDEVADEFYELLEDTINEQLEDEKVLAKE